MANTTEDDELITDLEAFHRELQTSVGFVRDMVASWMPAQSAKNAFPDALDNNEDFAPFRGRPERLGLGLEKHSSATTAVATAHPDSMEGKLFKGITQSGKKRKAEEPESIRSPAPPAKNAATVADKQSACTSNGTPASTNRDDDDDDEESRSKSIKAKPNKAPISTNNFFKTGPTKAPSSAAAKKVDSAKVPASDASKNKVISLKPPASPAKDKQASKANPPPPVKPPYAIPPSQLDHTDADDDAPSPSVDESIATEATESTQAAATGEAAKKKRKRNKKKKNKQGTQVVNGETSQPVHPEKLFGDSVIE